MKIIDFNSGHRRKHFEFFRKMEMPHFNLVAHIPFDQTYAFIKENNLHFSTTLIYLICRTANDIPELRWRIRGERIVEHEIIHPSFSVNTEVSDVFSFCYVDYDPDFQSFSRSAITATEEMKRAPSFENDAQRDDLMYLSGLPWIHFTSISHAMPIPVNDSIPRISWGKLGPGKGDTLLPLSIQVHHALVDGRHVGMFFERFEEMANSPQSTFS